MSKSAMFDVDGVKYEIDFTRRRYGQTTTFTWVDLKLPNGEWVHLGDPWQCIMPKHEDIRREIRNAMARFNASTTVGV